MKANPNIKVTRLSIGGFFIERMTYATKGSVSYKREITPTPIVGLFYTIKQLVWG